MDGADWGRGFLKKGLYSTQRKMRKPKKQTQFLLAGICIADLPKFVCKGSDNKSCGVLYVCYNYYTPGETAVVS